MKKLYCMLLCLISSALVLAQNPDSGKKNDSLNITRVKSDLLPGFSSKISGYPNGWGTYRKDHSIGGIGINFMQVSSFKPNLAARVEGGAGIIHNNLNVSGALNVNDVRFRNYSLDLKISKIVDRGSSISVGGIHPLFRKNMRGQEFGLYAAFSHAIQALPSRTPGFSKLSYTLGISSRNLNVGYFDKPGFLKQKENRSVNYFSVLSFEVLKNINANIGWSGNAGINLGLSTSLIPRQLK